MFIVDLNEQTNIIQVKISNENNSTIIAQGNFAVDKPDRVALILFNHIKIAPNNYQELDQFLSIVHSHVGKLYKSFTCIRLPATFDNRIDLNKLEFKTKIPRLMSVTLDHLKYSPDNNLSDKQEQYELITDKQLILNYSEQLVKMMNRDAYWAVNWNLEEMRNRINSATNNVIILDKINNLPCGFGRLFLLKTNDELFGYLSDIAIDSSHQSKGLGKIIANYFVGISVDHDMRQRGINGTLCLQCVDRGSGASFAPKIYKKLGFEFIDDIGNRISIFANKDYYVRSFE
jgi:ribosomal protein S18 acetylase RimI-like enzyme